MKKFDQINIIPFIDIMLVLLAIVLITASFISQGKIEVNVPKASNAVTLQADDLAKLLTVTKTGEFYLNDEEITPLALEEKIKNWPEGQKITLKVDEKTPFQYFVNITDIIAKFNLKNVAIVTIKDEQG